MGVGIVPMLSATEEIAAGKLISWWIEGAQINWEMGLARLVGGYESPISKSFLRLCREHFDKPAPKESRKAKSKTRRKTASAK
jgi:hypothetical protein